MVCVGAELACCLSYPSKAPGNLVPQPQFPEGQVTPKRTPFSPGGGDSRSTLRAGPHGARVEQGRPAGVAGLSSPTAGCVDTTEWPLERELTVCVEGEARQPPCHWALGHLKATTDCGCRLLLPPQLLLGTPCFRNWAVGLHPEPAPRKLR